MILEKATVHLYWPQQIKLVIKDMNLLKAKDEQVQKAISRWSQLISPHT
jgi:hypothetical protein